MSNTSNHVQRIGAFTLLSWLGACIHNRLELPHLTLLSPENSMTLLISVMLFLVWWKFPTNRTTTLLLLGWAFLHLIVGGIISVIPFAFLPFYPEQSLQHYLSHVLYGLAQLPLIIALMRHLRQPVLHP
jgi:hypothetical protein